MLTIHTYIQRTPQYVAFPARQLRYSNSTLIIHRHESPSQLPSSPGPATREPPASGVSSTGLAPSPRPPIPSRRAFESPRPIAHGARATPKPSRSTRIKPYRNRRTGRPVLHVTTRGAAYPVRVIEHVGPAPCCEPEPSKRPPTLRPMTRENFPVRVAVGGQSTFVLTYFHDAERHRGWNQTPLCGRVGRRDSGKRLCDRYE